MNIVGVPKVVGGERSSPLHDLLIQKELTKAYLMPNSIIKSYFAEVIYDVMDMDMSRTLLGRKWHFGCDHHL